MLAPLSPQAGNDVCFLLRSIFNLIGSGSLIISCIYVKQLLSALCEIIFFFFYYLATVLE